MVGAYGEFSADLHQLVYDLVEAKIPGHAAVVRGARSHALPWARRQIAVAAMKRQADMIINGLAWCGPGGKEAYDRRHNTKRADALARVQMEAADYATMFRTHGHRWTHAARGSDWF